MDLRQDVTILRGNHVVFGKERERITGSTATHANTAGKKVVYSR